MSNYTGAQVKKRPLYLQSRWVLGHFIVLVVIIAMVNIGFWQLRRLHATEHANAQIRAHMHAPAVAVTKDNLGRLPNYQHVSVSGSWDAPDTYLLRYPIHLGQQGYWVIEPVTLDDGGTVYVNRGWISLDRGNAMSVPSDADGGSVQIDGTMHKAQIAHDPASTNEAKPPLRTQTAITQPWVQLISPAASSDPVPLDPPDLSNGSHFSYFLQWNAFAIITIIGWITLVVRSMRELAEREVIDLRDLESADQSHLH